MVMRSQRRVQDRYDLLEPLGRGGMGIVWLAEDSILQRKVAVKEVEFPPGVPSDEMESMRARVMREARAAARLNHHNVTTIYDVVAADDMTWIVMEYVAAPTLTEIVSRSGPLSVRRTAEIGLGVLSALEAAHAAGIIHRDVKPSNVMVPEQGNVKLADFGVAAVQGDPKITMTGLIIGSPSYMAPEQAQEGVSSTASDMWGLGTTLYFAVEGHPAFDKGAAIPTLTAVTYEPPATMHRAGELEPILLRLLEKDPQERLTAGELRVLLEEVLGERTRGSFAGGAPTTIYLDEPAAADDETPAPDDWTDGYDDYDDYDGYDEEAPRRRAVWPWVVAALLLLGIAALALPSFLGTDQTQVADDEVAEQEPARTNQRSNDTKRDDAADAGSGAAGAGTSDDTTSDDTSSDDTAANDTTNDAAAEDSGSGTIGDASSDTSGTADAGTSDDAASGSTGGAAVPPDWTSFAIADTGSTVAHPPEWSVSPRSETATDISDPEGGRYLRVDYTETPGDDAVEDWERQSDSFAGRHDDYQEISIEPYDYPGAETAALWEYTYTDGGAQLHAYNLAIVIGGRGYGLNFQTHEDRWAESQPLWEQFLAGFDPAE